MIPFSIIVAVDADHGIGKDGNLPWHLPGDLKYFKDLTTSTEDPKKANAVIMGRKTWQSIPERFRPLSSRLNVVITRDKSIDLPEDVVRAHSLEDALKKIDENDIGRRIDKVFVIGGQQVFDEAINHNDCRQLYITHIMNTFDCDRFLHNYEAKYRKIKSTEPLKEDGFSYYFAQYDRI